MNGLKNISIGTVSGGIVNFGGAVIISPISITKTISDPGENNSALEKTTNSQSNSDIIKKKTKKKTIKTGESIFNINC